MMGNNSVGFPPDLLPYLVAGYHLDGNANDWVGVNNGIATNITYAPAKVNDGAVFNGTTSVITIPNNISGSYSYAFFINPSSIGVQNNYGVLGSAGNGLSGLYFRANGGSSYGNIEYYLFGDYIFPTAIYKDMLSFCVVTFDGGTSKLNLFVNGIKDTVEYTGSYSNPITYLGNDIYGEALNGILDEITFFNTSLNQTQVDTLYNFYN